MRKYFEKIDFILHIYFAIAVVILRCFVIKWTKNSKAFFKDNVVLNLNLTRGTHIWVAVAFHLQMQMQ